jgi:hypothetical protein
MQPLIACLNSMGASSRERERIHTRTFSQVVVHKHLWIAVDMWTSSPEFTVDGSQLTVGKLYTSHGRTQGPERKP